MQVSIMINVILKNNSNWLTIRKKAIQFEIFNNDNTSY